MHCIQIPGLALAAHVRWPQERCWSSALVKLHFLLYNCAGQDGQRVPTCGAMCYTFYSCCFISLRAPFFLHFLFLLVMPFKSFSLLPQFHTQTPPVPSHQSRVLIHFGKAQPHIQHHFSCCPTVATTHLPHQHPRSSSGASRFESDAKSCGVAHKNGLV